ncbi:MAG: hypothetical protein ACYDAH_03065 [Steroidobacteraceae bacterium]
MLERLLAGADRSVAVADWRADAFRAIAQPSICMPGVAAAALCAERGPVEAASVFLAAPVHYVAEMSNVRLPADGILSLRRPEAEALAVDFNRVWSGAGIRLLSGSGAELFCAFDQPTEAATADPEDVLDGHVGDHLPAGAAAPRLRQLMSEIEMWLFEHPVNRARIAQAAPVLSGLWLWGGGPALASLPAVDGWTAGADPLFKAFAARPAPARSAAHPGAPPHAAAGVVVMAVEPGTDEWRDLEARWLVASLADLRAGRIERVDLSAGQRCYSVSARWHWRRWRRRQPWWEWFA